jgi:hypothetical protein
MKNDHVTDAMIMKLRDEAAAAGDAEQVALCDAALAPANSHPEEARRELARAECVRVICAQLAARESDV